MERSKTDQIYSILGNVVLHKMINLDLLKNRPYVILIKLKIHIFYEL